jgi:hypothetical protein
VREAGATHDKRSPFAAGCGAISVAPTLGTKFCWISMENALARVPSTAVSVKDLRPLRGAQRTRVLDCHPRYGYLLTRRSISASPFSKRTGEQRKEHSDG